MSEARQRSRAWSQSSGAGPGPAALQEVARCGRRKAGQRGRWTAGQLTVGLRGSGAAGQLADATCYSTWSDIPTTPLPRSPASTTPQQLPLLQQHLALFLPGGELLPLSLHHFCWRAGDELLVAQLLLLRFHQPDQAIHL